MPFPDGFRFDTGAVRALDMTRARRACAAAKEFLSDSAAVAIASVIARAVAARRGSGLSPTATIAYSMLYHRQSA